MFVAMGRRSCEKFAFCASAALVLLGSFGCSGETASPVSGTITLDDQPLAGALVSFVSQNDAIGNAIGITDDHGHYELQQSQSVKGLPAGSYRVHISTFRPGGEPGVMAVNERVPACYNVQSALQATIVRGGDNHFDFRLSSQRILQSP